MFNLEHAICNLAESPPVDYKFSGALVMLGLNMRSLTRGCFLLRFFPKMEFIGTYLKRKFLQDIIASPIDNRCKLFRAFSILE